MAEVLVPADAEAAALAELSAGYAGLGFPGLSTAAYTVGTVVPSADPRPDEFVRVLAVGGPRVDLIYDAFTVVLEGSSVDEGTAFNVCSYGVALLEAAGREGSVGGVACRRVRVVALPGSLPDPRVTSHSRYSATLSVVLRRTAVVPTP